LTSFEITITIIPIASPSPGIGDSLVALGRIMKLKAILHRSKVDTWLLATLVFSAAVSIAAAGFILYIESSPVTWVAAIFTTIAGAGLPIWLLTSTYYKLESGSLLVSCGPFKFNIRLADITSITQSRSLLSSPALSVDRLRIGYGSGKSLMISPSDKEQFLKDIRTVQNDAA